MKHRLDPLLRPRSIAFVGASTKKNTPGNDMLRMAVAGRYGGAIYPVNPNYGEIEGRLCYPSLTALPRSVDHVVLALANHRIEQGLREAIEHGARAATIFASCYLEHDAAPPLPQRLAAMAREADLAICGGNGMGFCNPEIGLQVAAFACPTDLAPGGIAWIAQSGSVFGALAYNDRRLKFNLCVSSGAEIVTRLDDYMAWALAQPSTQVIGLFVESVRDPGGFTRCLEEACRLDIPVVVLKAGRTPQSAAMAKTHTGALAGDDTAYQALFDRYGVCRVHTVDEMAATLMLLSHERRARRGGIATIHDSGGECELWTDLASDLGVPFARINATTRAALEKRLDPGLAPVNPLDAWGTGHDAPRVFEDCMNALMADPDTAAGVIVSNMRGGHYHTANLSRVARAVHAATDKLLVFANNYSLLDHRAMALALAEDGVPVIDGTRAALVALKNVLYRRDYLARPRSAPPSPPAPALVTEVRRSLESGGVADEREALQMLRSFGIEVAGTCIAGDARQAAAAARRLGYPVALKTAAPGIAHKSDVNGVRINLASARAVRNAYADLSERLGPRVLVSKMAPPGIELSLGAFVDPQFGPCVMVAAGGVLIELLRDKAVALAPFDAACARRLLASLAIYPLLQGARGGTPADMASLTESIARFSVLVDTLGDRVEQIDVNPFIAAPHGATAVDALVITRRSRPRESAPGRVPHDAPAVPPEADCQWT